MRLGGVSLLSLLLLLALLLFLRERIWHKAHFDLGVLPLTWLVFEIIWHHDRFLEGKHIDWTVVLSEAVLDRFYL